MPAVLKIIKRNKCKKRKVKKKTQSQNNFHFIFLLSCSNSKLTLLLICNTSVFLPLMVEDSTDYCLHMLHL